MLRIEITIILLFYLVACPNTEAKTFQKSESNLVGTTNYPAFSWNNVQLYMHIRKSTSYTSNEFNYLGGFPLITLEKTTGSDTYGSTEEGSIQAARGIKAKNPNAKVLYYRNVMVNYGTYSVNTSLGLITDPYLKNSTTGEVLRLVGTNEGYDLSNANVRKWWVDHCKYMSNQPEIDGIFVDGNVKAITPGYLLTDLGQAKKDAVLTGYGIMMDSLYVRMTPGKMKFSNLIRATLADSGLGYMHYFDGSYLENFDGDKDYYATGIAAAQSVARSGKIIAFTFQLDPALPNPMPIDQNGYVALTDALQQRLNFLLSIYLICAEQYSYLLIHDGYGSTTSALWMTRFAEYDKPLGEPFGQAVKNGYVYTRKFKNVDVTLDLNTMTGTINWLNNTLTNTTKNENNISIYSSNKKLILKSDIEQKVNLYTALGIKVWCGFIGKNVVELQLPVGVYILKEYNIQIINQ